MKKSMLFDCVITYGELDPKWYGHYKEGFKTEIVKHAVSQQEAQAWHGSPECMMRVWELEKIGQEKFGDMWFGRWDVSYFWTTASEEGDKE